MVGTISPLVQGRKRQWVVSVVLLLVGGAIAASALATVLGVALHPLLPSLTVAEIGGVLVVGAVITSVIELVLPQRVLPCIKGSVPQRWWIDFGPTIGSLLYGVVLGTGITTVIPFAAFYWVGLSAILIGPKYGWAIGGAYGFGRGLAVPIASGLVTLGFGPQRVCGVAVQLRGAAKATCGVATLLAAVCIVAIVRS